jgi:hypothetical protein
MMAKDENYIHEVGGAVDIHCECGSDTSSGFEGEAGTDEFEMTVDCEKCGKTHVVRITAELLEVKSDDAR